MEESLVANILKVYQALNRQSVEYLIVGGTAVAFHGYYRMSAMPSGLISDKHDLDLWYNPTYKNYYNLLNAMDELGINVKLYKEEVEPNPKSSFFSHEFADFKIDFLPEIIGMTKFALPFSRRVTSNINGIEIHVISLEDLIASKKSSSRQKDLEDLTQLKLIHKK